MFPFGLLILSIVSVPLAILDEEGEGDVGTSEAPSAPFGAGLT